MNQSFDRPTLPAVGWVKSLKGDDRELLATYGEFISVEPDHDLIRQGDQQDNLYLVIAGSLEVRREGIDRDIIVGSIKEGESIGEISIFDPGEASASVRAYEFSQIWRISRENLNSFLTDNQGAGVFLMVELNHILSKRLRKLNALLVDAKSAPFSG
ncbi:MAG: cyclic nucleotide-binding domain-containing protein [Verrucomicrobiota bacterium]